MEKKQNNNFPLTWLSQLCSNRKEASVTSIVTPPPTPALRREREYHTLAYSGQFSLAMHLDPESLQFTFQLSVCLMDRMSTIVRVGEHPNGIDVLSQSEYDALIDNLKSRSTAQIDTIVERVLAERLRSQNSRARLS